MCSDDGYVFDILNIVPYIQRFHRHPVSGQPLELRDLTKLHFHKNAAGEYACPVLNKVFTESTHIVAVKTSGNVYCYQARIRPSVRPSIPSHPPSARRPPPRSRPLQAHRPHPRPHRRRRLIS